MGIVYSALHHKTRKRVAIKMLSPHLLTDSRHRKRFQRESHITSQIQHRGLVRIFGHGATEDGNPYILMEYLAGLSLHTLLLRTAGDRLPITTAIEITIQLADALHTAHATGLVHSDIKPSNIMLTESGRTSSGWHVKLLDFGVARLLIEGDGGTTSDSDVIGTPAYMSPEQCQGRGEVDARSDVYGLGVLLFEMLCGRPPFVGPKLRVMYQHVYESAPSIERFCPEADAELCRLLKCMLAKSKLARPAMDEVSAQLRTLIPELKSAPTPLMIRRESAAVRSALRLGVFGLAGAVLAGALGYTRVLFRSRSPAAVITASPQTNPTPPVVPLPAVVLHAVNEDKLPSPTAEAERKSPATTSLISAPSKRTRPTAPIAEPHRPPVPRASDTAALPESTHEDEREAKQNANSSIVEYWN